jgi:DNA repair protein RecN (Recombination protein N)
MIRSLHIENYALIERLDIELRRGFSVITGETGAGKSILLGAIGLLKGQRADVKAIKQGARRCVVEATFDVSDYGMQPFFEANDLDFDGRECIIRREISDTGKSRGFVNDSPVTMALLKQLGDQLIDIHSQHQNLLLGREDFQLDVLDILAQDQPLAADYQATFQQLRQLRRSLAEATETAGRSREEEDYLRFQAAQLEEARLCEGQQAELEAELERLEHAEEIKQDLFGAAACIEDDHMDAPSVLSQLKSAAQLLDGIAAHLPAAGEWADRLHSCHIELKDIAAEIGREADSVEHNPERLEQVNQRLGLLYDLEKKHRVDSDADLLRILADLSARLAAIDHSDEHIAQLRSQCEALEQQARQQAAALSQARTAAARDIEQRMTALLQPLGMPNVRFEVSITHQPDNLTPSGADNVRFRFSANKNGQLQDVADVASGGEIARVMLSLKSLIASAVKLPTIIFDEIDTGVSGSIAEKMARMMKTMGQSDRQVVSITHLPQIAALGSTHYKVYKQDGTDTTTSHIAELGAEERVEEIAHMLSGETLSPAALDNARTLLRG